MGFAKVKVGVRVRPFSSREKALPPGEEPILTIKSSQILISNNNNNNNNNRKVFTFDHVFGPEAEQGEVFESAIGQDLIESAFLGYNACLFSYGQTGSGKTFTMLGNSEARGIIPRLCTALFTRIVNSPPSTTFKIEVSYMEIYNEKVRDLLTIQTTKYLRVREHALYGPYVDGLSLLAVKSAEDINNLMEEGNKSRTVAATNMNSESSRSHAVFSIVVSSSEVVGGVVGEKVSRVALVDLAGSERAVKSGAVGERLKEGSNINKSLTTLGLVISKLAEGVSEKSFVPYRDSTLTWLLKDSLGGNSRTIMIATVSPSGDNYEETLSTLRYADRAKRIVNNAVVNEDPNAKLIRELQEEVKALREMLKSQLNESISDQLSQSEKLMRQVSETWEEKLERSQVAQAEHKQALEKMGISVQQAGISVEKDRFYLVNLNADPSLNELLVYYLKQHTLIGRPESNPPPDIQLSGLGIESRHCELHIEDNALYLIPYPNASTCVNGEIVLDKRMLHHADRILWGNHHFFRLNSPGDNKIVDVCGQQQEDSYALATLEHSLQQQKSNPIAAAVAKLESKHRKDKQVALEKQRLDLERQFNALIHVLSPTSPNTGLWEKSKEKSGRLTEGLKMLKECLLVVNKLVMEATEIVGEMGIGVEYGVVLLIPPGNLTPGRVRGALVTSPSIRVTSPSHHPQIWSMDKLQNRLADMREAYQDYKLTKSINTTPFFEPDQPHILLGIANVFLQVLFYDDVCLNYPVPVISQQGEIVGRLSVEIGKVSSSKLEVGDYEEYEEKTVTVKVTVRHLAGVDQANLVFCQYVFCDNVVVVPPTTTTTVVRFDDTKYFTIPVSEEFIEYAEESALSIEVWGHRGIQNTDVVNTTKETNNNSVTDRWKEVTSQMRVWVEIQELNENGDYAPVEVAYPTPPEQIGTGGIHMLKQGLQRRIRITAETNASIGQLPIVCDEIDQVSLGAITQRSVSLQRVLDSYQEVDLGDLREKWGEALRRRRIYLDSLLQDLARKQDKTIEEEAREKSLVTQWLTLTEERNAVLVPAPDSGVPGAPSRESFRPEVGMEEHMPVVFLDISEDILLSSNTSPRGSPCSPPTAGLNSLLPKEHDAVFVPLPMIRKSYGDFYSAWSDQRMSTESWALVSWDSSVHDCPALNKPTPQGEVIYVILRIALRLSHPVQMDCVLRKRICLSVKRNRPTLTERLKSRFFQKTEDTDSEKKKKTGVTYQIVSHLPKSSEQLETRESLANLAVSHGESYIEEYLRSISAVDSILNLDRMRQSVYLREEQLKTRPVKPEAGLVRKTLSVPNISQLFVSSSMLKLPDTTTERKMRSESLANLAGVLKSDAGVGDRPSSLSFGPTLTPQPASTSNGPGKWTSLMSSLVEEVEESSSSGHVMVQKEDEPTTTG